ncbi:uncharacterized protein LOC128723780 [Anopheles nili]|uniref:uncharacterized protein LOC128723780 n=1 Tax=Anopheles nili TaxID=185578 RepID=UPI00237A819F|nr:uncharacterized protein LOC128723780 [Anopheles nili]
MANVSVEKRIPAFVDVPFLQRVLEENLNHDAVRVDGFTAQIATKPGDNYSSDVFTIVVHYNGDREIRLVAKIVVGAEVIKTFAEKLNAFTKEVYTFRTLLPTFTRIVADGRTDDSVQFGARCFYATREPVDTIVFEDLKHRGYQLADRTRGGLDLAHCELIMRKIGLFHAASMVYVAQGSTERRLFTERYSRGIACPGEDTTSNPALVMFYNGLVKFLEVSANWPELDRTIWRKLEALQSDYTRRVIECLSAEGDDQPEDGYRVLNHGDLWGNNMMFRYGKDEIVQEVMFVDYQLSNYGSPGLDLVYCLYNCAQFEVRENRINDLLQVYYGSLCEGLRIGGYQQRKPTFDDVLKEFARHEFIGLVSGLSMLPIIMMERTECDAELSFDNLLEGQHAEKLRDIQYQGKLYRQSVIPILERFHARGLLD